MRVDIVTIFPEMLREFFQYGILKAAQENGVISVNLCNLRDFTDDKHRTVDDRPFGGGPGMVLKPGPIFRAVEKIKKELLADPRVVLLSARGKLFDQKKAEEFSHEENIIFICGRYEGVDERVQTIITDEISIGNFVLSGGEAACICVIEAVCRLVPGVLGNFNSIKGNSFQRADRLGPPQYTRPREFRGLRVPEVLLSGNHEEIKKFREEKAREKTMENRPDLLGD
jgi:tRNA (guanine37-N1)-methyltransferase